MSMSVESYLESIRKNTISNSDKTAKLNSTIKDLLNYESLKKAISDGVEKGNKVQFKRLAELSKKILTSSDATAAELKEINALLKLFYAQIPKNSNGNASVPADAWIRALKEVLDEFGDKLPQKFQNRMKNDIVSAAAAGGADPKLVMQQVNMQVNQTVLLENIYNFMEDREKKLERKAEAEKPIANQEKRDQSTFWQTRMGKVIDNLGGILKNVSKVGAWLGMIYVGLGVWQQLAPDIQKFVRSAVMLLNGWKSGALAGSLAGALKMPAWLKTVSSGKWLEGIGSKIRGLFGGSNLLTDSSKEMSVITKIQAFFLRTRALAITAIQDIAPVISKTARELFPTFAKVFDWIKSAGTNIYNVYKKIQPGIKVVGSWITKIFGFLGKLKPFLGMAGKALGSLGKFIPGVGWILQAIISLADFIQGFKIDGIRGGLRRVGVEFVAVFGDMVIWIIQGLKKLVGTLPKKLSEGAVKTLDNLENSIRGGLGSMRSGVGYDSKSQPQLTDSFTGTVYTGRDALKAATPLYSSATGTMPTSAAGINKKAGVKLSSQAADFYKRAGLSNRITSGMEGQHAGTASNPRSHYSGNKFDLAISTTSVTAFANEVRKMLKTPGLVEIRTESVPSKIVEGARAILKKEGLNTAKLINDGYPSYSTGPHLDVLIDPKYSGVATPGSGSQKLTSTITNIESVADTGEPKDSNPLTTAMQSQIAQAYNEQIKLFEKGAKTPDQLASNQNKATVSAISTQIANQSSGDPITFRKQDDIFDPALTALQQLFMA